MFQRPFLFLVSFAAATSLGSVALQDALAAPNESIPAANITAQLQPAANSVTISPSDAQGKDWHGWVIAFGAALAAVAVVFAALKVATGDRYPQYVRAPDLSTNGYKAKVKGKGNIESTNASAELRQQTKAHPRQDKLPLQLPEADSKNSTASMLSASEASEQHTADANSVASRLPRMNIAEELIHDLHSPDPLRRRKAIWELGQRGASDAIQPLTDLMIESDSSQRSLILASISEIAVRALKPVNRALLLSLQDASPDVRKNAIRDVTRIYDLIAEISQLISHASSDPNSEVRETANWALGQLNRIRTGSPLGETLPGFMASNKLPDSLPQQTSAVRLSSEDAVAQHQRQDEATASWRDSNRHSS